MHRRERDPMLFPRRQTFHLRFQLMWVRGVEPLSSRPEAWRSDAKNPDGFHASWFLLSFPLSYTHSRGGGTRTHGLRVPNAARYQAALHPERTKD